MQINGNWGFLYGTENPNPFAPVPGKMVNLPNDYMIASKVTPDAPAGSAMGYFTEKVAHYRKIIAIPQNWEDEEIFLRFDGVMMNASVLVNGDQVCLHHNGYFPFEVNITRQIYCGEDNEIKVIVNPSMQPNSRWYSGAGILRDVELVHVPKLHIAMDGVYGYTANIDYDESGKASYANIRTETEVVNDSQENVLAEVEVYLTEADSEDVVISRKQMIQVDGNDGETAYINFNVPNPKLWSCDEPNLYRLHAKVTQKGMYKTHRIEVPDGSCDETSTLFGVREITADAIHGLRINRKVTKLKGGCLHHDNGVLGAISVYDAEYRRIQKLKELGFNAIRTTHNPPSRHVLEACNRLGVYVFDEAFDCWNMGKKAGDFGMFFESDWEKDLENFIKRDRSQPCVIIWSTGNEITERGGLGNGYIWAAKLAKKVRSLDHSRPISNGVCSFWNGLDNKLMDENRKKMMEMMSSSFGGVQNADANQLDLRWEQITEPFMNGLDIAGYNYMEDKYPADHELFPDRVILGSENYPKEIGKRWPMVESTPYVIGDFTWTAWDYIGEAGIGKSKFWEPNDLNRKMAMLYLSSQGSEYPWRLANDADFDINGNIRPQGEYRGIVWGNGNTRLYLYDPKTYGKEETVSQWGFTDVHRSYSWRGAEGRLIRAVVFSAAEEVELLVNGVSASRKKKGEALAIENLPLSFVFDLTYEPGIIEAVSYTAGREISRDHLCTAGEASKMDLTAEKGITGELTFIQVNYTDEKGELVYPAEIKTKVETDENVRLLGFGSANPINEENYTDQQCTSYHGQLMAVVSGNGRVRFMSDDPGVPDAELMV